MATIQRKVVKTLTISGITFPIISAPPAPGTEAETVDVAAFGDDSITTVVAAINELSEFVVTVLDEGAIDPPIPGANAETITIAATLFDGTTAGTSIGWTGKCQISDVEPGVVDVEGEKRSILSITLVPVGGADDGK